MPSEHNESTHVGRKVAGERPDLLPRPAKLRHQPLLRRLVGDEEPGDAQLGVCARGVPLRDALWKLRVAKLAFAFFLSEQLVATLDQRVDGEQVCVAVALELRQGLGEDRIGQRRLPLQEFLRTRIKMSMGICHMQHDQH